jgi:glutamate-1-semialdehyde 2,1-aminomutase
MSKESGDMSILEEHDAVGERSLLERYRSLSNTSRRLYDRACKVLPDGTTRRSVFFPPYPAYIVRGEGCKVYDVDDHEYIDYTNNLGPLILGHKHPKVMQAILEQLECGTVLGGPTELEIQLAEKILESLPGGDHVLFCASGTEANMIGLRAVRAYTGKDKILKCVGAYHGTSDSFAKGTGIPEDVQARTLTVPFNDIERFETALKKHRDELAAVFIEPILRGIPPHPEYLKQVREISEQNGVLLAFDEVVTGFRLGRGGAQEKWGVKPDMTLLGKIIGGGFPIGAVVTSKELWQTFKSPNISGLRVDPPAISHAGTFNGHPLSMAAGLATLEALTPTTYAHLDKMGKILREGMEKASAKAGVVAQVVGVGSVFHIYFTDQPVVDDGSAETPNPLLIRSYDLNMLMRGIYPGKGHCSFVSTPITTREVKQTLEAVEDTLFSMRPFLKKIAPHLT